MDYCVGSHLFTFICSNFKEEQYSLIHHQKYDMRIKNKRNTFCNIEKLQSKIDVQFHYRIISFLLLFNCISSYSQQASIYGIPFGSSHTDNLDTHEAVLLLAPKLEITCNGNVKNEDAKITGITPDGLILNGI